MLYGWPEKVHISIVRLAGGFSTVHPDTREIKQLERSSSLERYVQVRREEVAGLGWSFAYFFCLLCGYLLIRPVRDEMAIRTGADKLQWLLTATFLAMLAVLPVFGWISSRFARRKFLSLIYLFFAANLIAFYVLFSVPIDPLLLAPAFFVWVSTFNMFVVSVFWSFMADLFTTEQARRLYGFIAAGGTAGAISGSLLATGLALALGVLNLLLLSSAFLLATVVCIERLNRWALAQPDEAGMRAQQRGGVIRGSSWAGVSLVLRSPYLLGICLYLVFYTVLSTFLYGQQMRIVSETLRDSAQRTALFASMDLAVNLLALPTQVFVFNRFLAKFGTAAALMFLPLLSLAGFVALGAYPVLPVVAAVSVLRRAGEFAIAKPVRETLFNLLSPEEKYKAKNFMDTAVYRGGDMAGGWLLTGLKALGLGIAGIAFVAAPVAAAWAANGLWLARRHRRLQALGQDDGASQQSSSRYA
jgi:AAA family ATP:ADP antiporter